MRTLLALTAVALLTAAQEPKPATPTTPAPAASAAQEKGLAGTWVTESIEDSGSKMPADEAKKWSVEIKEGGEFTLRYDGKKHSIGTVKHTPSANPKTFEFTFKDGPWQGATFVGVYKLEGDTYTICYAEKGRMTPTTFTTKPEAGQMLVVYKREKKAG
jgi:uncharacterized protein (TIGR03067 family)